MSGPRGGEFSWAGPDDFVRLDGLCAGLLGEFFGWLRAPEAENLPAERASLLAHAADRYLRDFVVDIAEAGPANASPSLPRRYLANWYIVHTMAPSHAEIDVILAALLLLYRYLEERGIVDAGSASEVEEGLADGEYFHRRLEGFWGLTPEGIDAWRREDDYRRPPAGDP